VADAGRIAWLAAVVVLLAVTVKVFFLDDRKKP
jgi:hypothetical protein